MKKSGIIFVIAVIAFSSFNSGKDATGYHTYYNESINKFAVQQEALLNLIKSADLSADDSRMQIKKALSLSRLELKNIDLWLRYFEPVAYKKINGPLPVEWENEVFEKYEIPYRRVGAGLTLAELYLNEKMADKDSLLHLIQSSVEAIKTYLADSITGQLDTCNHFFLANRLYLLNLATIYTTGFECPGKENIIAELQSMVSNVKNIYYYYNQSFPDRPLTKEYLDLYAKTIVFVNSQPRDYTQFDHFTFIRDYVNPLFRINQQLINDYKVVSVSYNDYTLNNKCTSIFDKSLYQPQNTKGIYSLVDDTESLGEINKAGKLLFYDPILSGNNERACASCHKPTQYFTDNTTHTALQFNRTDRLTRNTPTLINVVYNHLIMLDGKHITLQGQGRDVITNPIEMGGNENEIIEKVMSCKEYKTVFKKALRFTPEEHEITLNHLVSAITMYYSEFSNYSAPFDNAMNNKQPVGKEIIKGFNLFMGKAQCATCHYVPQFNGVKPPFISSEFEVIGVPEDKGYKKLSNDRGRYVINAAPETDRSFRTGSLRNAQYTAPYMHNGVFNTLDEVMDFYEGGGGAGHHLAIKNQTLSSDSLKLTENEKKDLISFLHSLNEHVIFQTPPESLPASKNKALNSRKVGGNY